MYYEENISRLEEVGVEREEVEGTIKINRWILEYCKPEEIFLLKLAFLIKFYRVSGRVYKPRIVAGSERKLKRFFAENRVLLLNTLLGSNCSDRFGDFMRENFSEFLGIERSGIGVNEYLILAKAISKNITALHTLMEADVELGMVKEEDLSAYAAVITARDCAGMLIGIEEGGGKKHIYPVSGIKLETRMFKEATSGFMKISERFFSSDKWKTLKDFWQSYQSILTSMKGQDIVFERLGVSLSDMLYMLDIERFYKLFKKQNIFERFSCLPADFGALLTSYSTKILSQYL